MFIEITNKDLSVIQIGEIISEKKKNGLTPEDAIEILGMTNHYAHINSVIRIISKLPKEEQLNYKDFVIGAVDGREISKAIYERLQAFAVRRLTSVHLLDQIPLSSKYSIHLQMSLLSLQVHFFRLPLGFLIRHFRLLNLALHCLQQITQIHENPA